MRDDYDEIGFQITLRCARFTFDASTLNIFPRRPANYRELVQAKWDKRKLEREIARLPESPQRKTRRL